MATETLFDLRSQISDSRLSALCAFVPQCLCGYESIMQNKAKVKIGKMNISVATTKHYDKNNEQSAMNVIQNKANSNPIQSQSKPICILPQRTLSAQRRRIFL